MSETTCYAIAKVDAAGKPVAYLPYMGENWQPTMSYSLTPHRSKAWRFPVRWAAEETLEVMKATTGDQGLKVIGIDCDGPPLTLAP
ncbi:hypothetical protein AO501_19395 [Mycobacterium gordonae]|uniref:Uncharacterized protein n=1 Tax=Mycobacterium gordonae TaxID=1778 RepID=A0A0Q2LH07_MYCGO|nr:MULTISPECIES: hypothetical protein [Mycobacterium]KQH75042.1 hypothetical protein AO501_19395 [Mycobacterium gordonae]MDP7728935.1 hypothetical protein [Mycobacterium sp. TY813]